MKGNWLNGEAMQWHYWTTPLPNVLSPLMHKMPRWFHDFECRMTLWIEGWPTAVLQLVPLQIARTLVFALYGGLLLMINTTGSYGHLGWLSIFQSAR